MEDARPGERLAYRLSPQPPDGRPAFTAPADLGAIVRYVTTDAARDHLTRIRDGATTALLG
ncbi:hypothetical protein [Streptomyces flavofungini]|uniref:hypothetical protein n=1 Tax=Streptomyces flavofungini TaxID=68200 RepID=UPI00339D8C11